jgi:UDP-3-O-[3-hydroxymyristoyl] glucosamine N-acyltransferase
MSLSIAELAGRIGADLVAGTQEAAHIVKAVAPVDAAGPDEVTFAGDDKHKAALEKSRAGAVIVSARQEGITRPQLVVKNVNAALIEALKAFAPQLKRPPEGIDPTAKIARTAQIGKGVSIGPYVVIDDGVQIGQDSVVVSGCVIGENTRIGQRCRLDGNVVIYHNCRLGDDVIVHANTTIGATGFGYAFIDGAHRLIPHNGGVVIEDFVEIGANCCVDRAKFGDTVIGAGTKIDNLVQIAHNVVIGKCCLIAAQAGISGSCRLGDGVVLAGQVGLADNIEIGSRTMIGAQAGVMADAAEGSVLAWSPAMDRREALRVVGLVRRLPQLAEQLKQLDKRIQNLESSKDNKV